MILGGVGASRALSESGAEGSVLYSSGELVEYIGAYGAGVARAGIPQA